MGGSGSWGYEGVLGGEGSVVSDLEEEGVYEGELGEDVAAGGLQWVL